ncbi:MAG: hypothetical protein NT157_04505 [Candidatus Micrarchaeota archaeon]|nr:hypothetical protein [Candidatus Micrarchaeota archaeon]
MNFEITRRKILFFMIFGAAAMVADQINFSRVLGAENQYFTLFQFFGPLAAAFIGIGMGVAAILAAELANFVLLGKAITLVNVARLFPMLFAAYYFARNGRKESAIVPIVCMILFAIHPIGAQAWYYSLYWLIPVIAMALPNRLLARSLGATFTAHAVGSIIWLYSFPSTPEFWVMLIPVVAFERVLFAGGISISYVGFNSVLARLENMFDLRELFVDKRYVLAPAKAKIKP